MIVELSLRNGHYKVVELLLKNSKSNLTLFANNSIVIASKKGNEAIRIASERGYYDIVKTLLKDSRVDPSDCSNEALVLASKTGNHKMVKLLLNDKRVEILYIKDPYMPITLASSKTNVIESLKFFWRISELIHLLIIIVILDRPPNMVIIK
jgi:hypothetical protein